MMKNLAMAVVALVAFTSCASKNECKFNEKEYAERKTAHLNEIVNLTDEQQKEIYSIFEAQGLEMKENLKNMKCGEGQPAEFHKPMCDKKAECKKAECDKAKCEKRAECKKAECDKAKCEKRAECKKAECDKAMCEKKAECKKAECGKEKPRHPHHMVAPEKMKETMDKIAAILTPEQMEILKAHHQGRRECASSMKECCTTPAEK